MHIVVLYDHLLLPCVQNVRATRPPRNLYKADSTLVKNAVVAVAPVTTRVRLVFLACYDLLVV